MTLKNFRILFQKMNMLKSTLTWLIFNEFLVFSKKKERKCFLTTVTPFCELSSLISTSSCFSNLCKNYLVPILHSKRNEKSKKKVTYLNQRREKDTVFYVLSLSRKKRFTFVHKVGTKSYFSKKAFSQS